jgi:hypothetical protein
VDVDLTCGLAQGLSLWVAGGGGSIGDPITHLATDSSGGQDVYVLNMLI